MTPSLSLPLLAQNTDNFFPFGEDAGDTNFTTDTSRSFSLTTPFVFYSTPQTSVVVSREGGRERGRKGEGGRERGGRGRGKGGREEGGKEGGEGGRRKGGGREGRRRNIHAYVIKHSISSFTDKL